jgi:hypothetical protein
VAKFFVEVRAADEGCYVVAVMPDGGFTKGPMSSDEAISMAIELKKQIRELRPPWWKRLLFWRGDEEPPVLAAPPKCPRHPHWKVVQVKGKLVCDFCRREVK